MAKADESKLIAAISHLGILFLPVILPLLVYLAKGKEDKYIKYHALQATVYQALFFVIMLVLVIIGMVIGVVTLGFGMIIVVPVIILLSLVLTLYGLWATYQAFTGNEKFSYLFVDQIVSKMKL